MFADVKFGTAGKRSNASANRRPRIAESFRLDLPVASRPVRFKMRIDTTSPKCALACRGMLMLGGGADIHRNRRPRSRLVRGRRVEVVAVAMQGPRRVQYTERDAAAQPPIGPPPRMAPDVVLFG
jgi:hypothetical protein